MERLNSDWTPDTSVEVEARECSWISAIVAQPNGKILVVGEFSRIGGVDRYGIARLDSDGRVDESFNAGAGLLRDSPFQWGGAYAVTGLVLDHRGDVLAYGGFTSVNHTGPALLARLHNGEWPVIDAVSVRRLGDGALRFRVTGEIGQPFLIEATTSLDSPNWIAISTNTITSGTSLGEITFNDPSAARLPQRYYRAVAPR